MCYIVIYAWDKVSIKLTSTITVTQYRPNKSWIHSAYSITLLLRYFRQHEHKLSQFGWDFFFLFILSHHFAYMQNTKGQVASVNYQCSCELNKKKGEIFNNFFRSRKIYDRYNEPIPTFFFYILKHCLNISNNIIFSA